MKQKNSHSIYTAADIQQYLEGKLSAAEMHAIEKAALEDPMLADAIEGIGAGIDYYQEDVRQLRAQLFQKRRRNTLLAWSSAAAVIIGLSMYGILQFDQQASLYKKKETTASIAMNKQAPETIDTGATVVAEKKIIPPATGTSSGTSDHALSLNKRPSKENMPAPANASKPLHVEKETMVPDSSRSIAPSVASAAAPIADKMEKADQEVVQAVPSPLQALRGRVPGLYIEQAPGRKDSVFRGYVRDNNGMPVAGAQVMSMKNKASTVSDQRGVFALKATTGDSSLRVQIAGHPENAGPVKGWKAYVRYLNKQKRRDPEDSTLKGTVMVRFYVEQDGALSDFHIEQSLSSFYDREAVRLIKEGPGWKLKEGERERVIVRIDF